MADQKLSFILKAVDKYTAPLKGVQKATAEVRQKIDQLNQQAKQVTGFLELKRKAGETETELEAMQRRVGELAKAMKVGGKEGKKLYLEFNKAKESAARLKQVHLANQERLHRLRQELKGGGVDTRRLTEHQQRLRLETGRLNDVLAINARLQERSAKAAERSAARRKLISEGVGRVKSGLATGARWAVGAAGAAAGIGYAFKRQFVDTAVEQERQLAILETLEGSAAKAKEAYRWVQTFATRTPYEVGQVAEAYTRLRAYGLEPTNGLLETLGNTSSAMGKDIMSGVEAIADAMTGENERLKEFGIKARVHGNKVVYEYTSQGKTMRKEADLRKREMIQSTLESIWNEKFAGAMDRQSRTLGGMLSNLSDMWTAFKLKVMESGLGDWLHRKLGGLLDELNRMAQTGELDKLAKRFSDWLVPALDNTWEIGKQLAGAFLTLAGVVDQVATALGGYHNLAYVLVTIPVATTIAGIAASFSMLAGAIGTVNAAAAAGFLGQAGLVGLAGWITGTQINKGVNGVVSWTTGKDQSLADWAYDKIHAEELAALEKPIQPIVRRNAAGAVVPGSGPQSPVTAQVAGAIRIEIDSRGVPRVTQIQSGVPGLDIQANVFRGLASYGY